MPPHSDSQTTEQSLETLQDIKRMMERSSRFISLSGLSGVSAGICALIGAYLAHGMIKAYVQGPATDSFRYAFELQMLLVAMVVLVAALVSSTFLTWRKARKSQLPIWDHASDRKSVV